MKLTNAIYCGAAGSAVGTQLSNQNTESSFTYYYLPIRIFVTVAELHFYLYFYTPPGALYCQLQYNSIMEIRSFLAFYIPNHFAHLLEIIICTMYMVTIHIKGIMSHTIFY